MNFVYCKNEEQIKKLLDFRQDSRVYFSVISELAQLERAVQDNLKYLVCVYINEDEEQVDEMIEVFTFLKKIKVKKYLALYSTNDIITRKFEKAVHEIINEPFLPRRLAQIFKAAHYALQKQLNDADTMQELTELWKEVGDTNEKRTFSPGSFCFCWNQSRSKEKRQS